MQIYVFFVSFIKKYTSFLKSNNYNCNKHKKQIVEG